MKAKQCVCGKYPKIEKKVSYSGGGRYKGQTKHESWQACCRGCSQQVLGYPETEAKAIAEWNDQVLEDRARRDSEDKLIYDLENSYYFGGHGAELRDRALARLLKDVKILLERTAP